VAAAGRQQVLGLNDDPLAMVEGHLIPINNSPAQYVLITHERDPDSGDDRETKAQVIGRPIEVQFIVLQEAE
jgi:hypothetical protein